MSIDRDIKRAQRQLAKAEDRLEVAKKLRYAERGPDDTEWRDVTAARRQQIKDEIAMYKWVLKKLAATK